MDAAAPEPSLIFAERRRPLWIVADLWLEHCSRRRGSGIDPGMATPLPSPAARLRSLYLSLAATYGPQHWWPSQSPLETIVGACLTQGTSWKSVERSLDNLRERGLLSLPALRALSQEELQSLIRPSGFMVRKAATLKTILHLLDREYAGSIAQMAGAPQELVRAQLLAIAGIGPETADAILLYALAMPVMVVDEYLRRVALRHGLAAASGSYPDLQRLALAAFAGEQDRSALADHCNEFHALIVQVGKDYCGRTPKCEHCPLRSDLDAHLSGQPVLY
jgi:endonuclease III related protein